ncbi:uncharacterized protein L3040_006580 [Drepanopeziza brunnea f. sp. 'multigermtubi']|nr:hypothetical protein L3040_006580 [Drepanopeziza brunnea f. sp. 'multigermtubi']
MAGSASLDLLGAINRHMIYAFSSFAFLLTFIALIGYRARVGPRSWRTWTIACGRLVFFDLIAIFHFACTFFMARSLDSYHAWTPREWAGWVWKATSIVALWFGIGYAVIVVFASVSVGLTGTYAYLEESEGAAEYDSDDESEA